MNTIYGRIGSNFVRLEIAHVIGHGTHATVFRGIATIYTTDDAGKVEPMSKGSACAIKFYKKVNIEHLTNEMKVSSYNLQWSITPYIFMVPSSKLVDYVDIMDYLPYIFDDTNLSGITLITVSDLAEGDIESKKIGDIDRLITDISKAIRELHEYGISHRDVKPANIVSVKTEDGTGYRLIDFSISCIISQCQPGGTLLYMSPAMLGRSKAAKDSNADKYTDGDWYAFGLTLYEKIVNEKYWEPVQQETNGDANAFTYKLYTMTKTGTIAKYREERLDKVSDPGYRQLLDTLISMQ